MGTISFKSVGITQEQQSQSQTKVEKIFGFKTPLQIGNGNTFAMHTSLVDQIQDNLKNLLMTQRGERLGRENFGTRLNSLVFELSGDDFDAQATTEIKTAVSRFMPFIVLDTFQSIIDHQDNENIGKIRIRITYGIPQLNVRNKAIEVLLFVGG